MYGFEDSLQCLTNGGGGGKREDAVSMRSSGNSGTGQEILLEGEWHSWQIFAKREALMFLNLCGHFIAEQ